MEPQDKAIELVDKYMLQTNNIDKAKELALKEVNKTIKSSYAYSCSDAYGRFMEDPFWREVEEEIQNL
tara:strand:- start:681 stop:884 length:204 start_codon:yes stop_codon:yes gene_type:complete